MLERLSWEDIDSLTVKYLQDGQSEVVRQTMIDALGAAHTPDCYTVMMQHVFHAKRPEAELLMRALFQLIDLSAPTPEVELNRILVNVLYSTGYNIKQKPIININ